MINKNKYLVTAIEANGFIRGQATQDRTEADRLYDHFVMQGVQYAEIRRLGPRIRHTKQVA